MENLLASRDNGFGFLDVQSEEVDALSFGSGVRTYIFDDMFNSSSSEFINFESFATWCDSPSPTDTLFTQYGLTRSFHDFEDSNYGDERSIQSHRSLYSDESSGKRRKVNNQKNGFLDSSSYTIPRSLSYSLNEKMVKALTLFMESSCLGVGEGILAQVWTPVKTGDQYLLSTCDQAYLLDDSRFSHYREVSKKFTFATEASQCSFPGLPGRVFISGVPEWTSNVVYYKKDEYLRINHAIDNEVRGCIAIPILEGTTCCAVIEIVTSKEKLDFNTEMDSICRALQAVDLRTSAIPRPQYFSRNQRDALAEIHDVLRAICHTHKLPLALAWVPSQENGQSVRNYRPNSSEDRVLCVEETACYVNDFEMEGFAHACLEHCLKENEGVVGKAFTSNQPCFSSDVKEYDMSEYPLVQHARKYNLNAAVAVKLKSTYTGEDDYILEMFLPVNLKGSLEQQLLLDDISSTMHNICRSLRTVSSLGTREMSNSPQTTLLDSECNFARSLFPNISPDKKDEITISQVTFEQDKSKVRTPQKKKITTEKNVSLSVLQQHFAGSLKDAAKSLGVCPTTLKRICRQHGITRWPSRKINKVNRSLKRIQTVLNSVQGLDGSLKFDTVTGKFVTITPFIQEFDTVEDTSFEFLDIKYIDNAIKLEEVVTTNQAEPFMETSVLMVEQTDLNGNEGIKNEGSSDGSCGFMLGGSSTSTLLTVKATYREDTIRFKFDSSIGCPYLYKEIGKRFKLQDGSFQLKYLDDEEEWVMLVTDSDLQECLEILYDMEKHTVKFLVHDLPSPIGSSSGGSNGYL